MTTQNLWFSRDVLSLIIRGISLSCNKRKNLKTVEFEFLLFLSCAPRCEEINKNMLKSFIFNLRSIPLTRGYVRRVQDPGIRRRLKLFSDDFVENDPEFLETLDSDFMNVHHASKEFEGEEKKFQQKVTTMMVGQKYFKEKGINFLTWNEKEQIRILNQQNPHEWTAEKLSESFPADPLSISKIIRNKWQPRDEARIWKHDESVRKSWQKFKSGELQVEPILSEHLRKFAHRDFNSISKPTENRKLGTVIRKPRHKEFSSIITSCKKYSEQKPPVGEEVPRLEHATAFSFPKHRPNDPEKDSYLLKTETTKTLKNMPLEEYQKYSPDIVLPTKTTEQHPAAPSTMKAVKKLQDVSVTTLSSNETKALKSLEIQEVIKIPKSVYKKDATYKVGDCFYDDDGEFLYRVPGLT